MIRPDNVLVWATFLPPIGAGVILALMAIRFAMKLPKSFVDQGSRIVTLLFSGLMLLCAILAWVWYDPSAGGLIVAGRQTGVQMVSRAVWIRAFNVEWFVGVDGLSISMVLLTGVISFIAAISSMPWWQGGAKAIEMAGMDEHGLDERLSAGGPSAICLECHPAQGLIKGTDHDLSVTAPGFITASGRTLAEGDTCDPCHMVRGKGQSPYLWSATVGPALIEGWEKTYSAKYDMMVMICTGCHAPGKVAQAAVPKFGLHPREKMAEGMPVMDLQRSRG